MSKQVLSDLDFNGVARIANLPDPVAAQHPATKAYVDAAVEGLAWKDSCRVATQANLNLAAPGATIDGVTMAVSDRVLVRSQTAASENGIYIWNGAAVAMTRSLDANTAAELEQAIATVEEGTSAAATFRQSLVNFALGTGAISWANFGTNAPAATEATAGIAQVATQVKTDAGLSDADIVTPLKLASFGGLLKKRVFDVGDGSATQYTLSHNLGTRDVQVEVFRTSGNFDSIMCDVDHLSATAVRLTFASAPSAAQFRCVVIG
jgi:hypothetical protein